DAFLARTSELLPQDKDFEIIGPIPAPLDRKAGKYRRQLILQAKSRQRLQTEFERVLAQIELIPESKRCRWSIDRDPHVI
ncbi:primosomal protein N', partial [Shewanella sp. SG41-4]|nr:primosomal protein N' [Shewanella sp. SG41-4]